MNLALDHNGSSGSYRRCGTNVRLIPAQFAKPAFSRTKATSSRPRPSPKPHAADNAVCPEEQTDLNASYRVRDQMVLTRTRLINQMRAFCLEYGIALGQGAGLFKLDLSQVLDDVSNYLSPAMRRRTFPRTCGGWSSVSAR